MVQTQRARGARWGLGLLLLGIALLGCVNPTPSPTSTPTATPSATVSASYQPTIPVEGPCGEAIDAPAMNRIPVRVVISGIEPAVTEDLTVTCGTSALGALQTVAASVDIVEYPFGVYVRGVNGLAENKDGNGKYWQYYINQKLGPVAMDQYKLYDANTVVDMRYEIPSPEQWN